jgi:hypothetical protein
MIYKQWDFVHDLASEAKWTPGLREIFEYRDLGNRLPGELRHPHRRGASGRAPAAE